MDTNLAKLAPQSVWQYFEQICQVPRPSKKEDKIRQYLVETAISLGLKYKVTQAGNVVIEKPATLGMEKCKKVTFQVHMDMVPAKLRTSTHNFETDPITAYIDGEWVTADGTTLGADNGIGIAYALAVLADKDISHGQLELLVTTDEETGMSGAFGLSSSDISGDILLNLDSEEDTEVCIGCAGGINTEIAIPFNWCDYDKTKQAAYKIVLDGLYSGHSGVDIHLGRANAIKEIAGFLYMLQQQLPFSLTHISGGRLRNVIPAYCEVIIVIDRGNEDKLYSMQKEYLAGLVIDYATTEKNLKLSVSEADLPEQVISSNLTKDLVIALHSCFNGVLQMDWEINIPQTSSNLGVIKVVDRQIMLTTLQRSPSASAKRKLAAMVGGVFELIGGKVEYTGEYPGWLPDLSSEMLRVVESSYAKLFGHKIKVAATHGGLECGLILDKFPDMDAVSIGATIRDPHSANERVSINSVAKVWQLLKDILARTPLRADVS